MKRGISEESNKDSLNLNFFDRLKSTENMFEDLSEIVFHQTDDLNLYSDQRPIDHRILDQSESSEDQEDKGLNEFLQDQSTDITPEYIPALNTENTPPKNMKKTKSSQNQENPRKNENIENINSTDNNKFKGIHKNVNETSINSLRIIKRDSPRNLSSEQVLADLGNKTSPNGSE